MCWGRQRGAKGACPPTSLACGHACSCGQPILEHTTKTRVSLANPGLTRPHSNVFDLTRPYPDVRPPCVRGHHAYRTCASPSAGMKRPAALWSVESDAKVIRSLSTVPKDAWRDEPCKKEYAGCRRYPSAWRETEQEAAFACDQRVSAAPFMCLKGRGLSEGVAGVDADAVTLAECAGSGADPELTWVLTTLTKDIEWKKPVFGGSYLQHRHLQPYSDSSVWRLHNEGGANLKSGTYDAKWPLKVQHMPAPCLAAAGVCPRRVLRAACCAVPVHMRAHVRVRCLG